MYYFNFPPYAKETTVEEEELHLVGEVAEVMNETFPRSKIIETLDVVHTAETLLRAIIKQNSVDKRVLDDCYDFVVKKNRERGYYGE